MRRQRTTEEPLAVYGANAVRELLASDVPVLRLLLSSGPCEAELRTAAGRRGVPAGGAQRGELDRLAGTPHHQGAVALTPPFGYVPLESLLEPTCRSLVLLDGVVDPRNLGAIIRTARAAGAGGVVVPQDRSVPITPVVVAASAGLVFGLQIARVTNLVRAMERLKEAGFWLVGLDARAEQPLWSLEPLERPAVVLGGEAEGMRALVRKTCDFTVSLPMAAGVESLNVAVAAGVVLYDLLVRRRPS